MRTMLALCASTASRLRRRRAGARNNCGSFARHCDRDGWRGGTMWIGVPLESAAGETRVAVTPETARKLAAQGHGLRVQSGAGLAASCPDAAYAAVGAEIADRAGAYGCELVLKVRSPEIDELSLMRPGTTLVGMLNPFDGEGLARLAAAGLTSYALEAAPRTSRAQSM